MNRLSELTDPSAVPTGAAANFRRKDLLALKFYPPLLLLSTATAGWFCILYVEKPTTLIVQAAPLEETLPPSKPGTTSEESATPNVPADVAAIPPPAVAVAPPPVPLLPTVDHLPGETVSTEKSGTKDSAAAAPLPAGVAEPQGWLPVGLTIQQPISLSPPAVAQPITTTLEIPILRRAGTMRWTSQQLDQASNLLARFKSHQQECLRLRLDAAELLDAWNTLLTQSSPTVNSSTETVASSSPPLAIQIANSPMPATAESPWIRSTTPSAAPQPAAPPDPTLPTEPPAPLALGKSATVPANLPQGWCLDHSPELPWLAHRVETSSDQSLQLRIQPPLLRPETDGVHTFTLTEPGFSAALGDQQASTTGVLLGDAIRQLEVTAEQLGSAATQLENLLLSLPKSQAQPPTPAKSRP